MTFQLAEAAGAPSAVRSDSGSAPTVRRHPTEGRTNMTKRAGEQADNEGGSDARLVKFGPQTPSGPPDVVFATNPLSPVAESRSLGLEIHGGVSYWYSKRPVA